jgi:predicted Zn-dependent protease
MKKTHIISILLSLILGLAACGSHSNIIQTTDTIVTGADKIGKYQDAKNIRFSEADEYYIGRRVLANFFASYQPLFDRHLTDYISRVGQTMAQVSQRPDVWAGYRFIVYKSPGISAYCMPGGFVLVSTGMLQLCDNEDQLAAVIGHELGHARWRHPLEALKKKLEADAKNDLVSFMANRSGSGMLKIFSVAAMINWEKQMNSYSRTQELEADVYSCWLMMRAGYHPVEMTRVLKKLPGGRTQYSKNHPSVNRRLQVVREEISRYPKIPPRSADRDARYKSQVLDYLAGASMGEVEYDGGNYRNSGEILQGPDASSITEREAD